MNRSPLSIIAEELAKARTRSNWNDRLAHWQRAASEHEEVKINRAARMVRNVVAANQWLTSEGIGIEPQGSYFNNTNVRLEADMDLRAQHSEIKIEYAPGVNPPQAYGSLGYFGTGRTFEAVALEMRRQLFFGLVSEFGEANVTVGTKALRVAGLDGSRADCDVVPAFKLHYVRQATGLMIGRYYTVEGVAILGTDGSWTFNYPEQHHANGKAKRERTAHRFKKVVRMLKRLNYELAEMRLIPQKLPSFLIECLVYGIEDELFLYQEDHYGRLVRVLLRIGEQVNNPFWAFMATEINDMKPLFAGQPWSVEQVKSFVRGALQRLAT